MLRPIIPDGGTHKGTSECQDRSCGKSTREGKPYCSKHIEQGWYIRQVIAQLKEAEQELADLEKADHEDPVRIGGFYIRETLLLLRMGSYSIKALSRRLDVSHLAARRLIDMLDALGMAVKKETSGGLTISGIGAPDLAPPPKPR